MINSVLFLCVGNICRSPTAEALLRTRLTHLRVRSAGLAALVGQSMDEKAKQLLVERGLKVGSHRAEQVQGIHCIDADLILVMNGHQKAFIENTYPFARGKVFKLGQHRGIDIDDPYRKDWSEFRRCLESIDCCVEDWISRFSGNK